MNTISKIIFANTNDKTRKLCNLHSQLILNFLPKSKTQKLNTESQCIAMNFLALEYSRNV